MANSAQEGMATGPIDVFIRVARSRYSGEFEKAGFMRGAKYRADLRVDDYIKSLPSWQQEVCWQVRDLVHAADKDVSETIKRTRLPYFTLDGNICAFLGAKDHLNIFIYDPIAPDPEGIINQGEGNSTARAIQVYEGEPINKRALLNLFKAIIANNRAGGWRRLRPRR